MDDVVGADNSTVVYNDQGRLFKIVDGETIELGIGADYASSRDLRLSPDGKNLLHTIGRAARDMPYSRCETKNSKLISVI